MVEHTSNPKYQDLLKTAHHLFWKHGFKRVSVQEVCREAGVSKMTFYRYFSNKEALALAVLQDMFDDAMKEYREIMEEDIPFADKVKKQVLMKAKNTDEISKELVKDLLADTESPLFKYWNERKNEAIGVFLKDFAEAQQKGWIRKDIKREFILYFFNKMIEMATDEYLLSVYDSEQELIMEMTNFYFYGISPRES